MAIVQFIAAQLRAFGMKDIQIDDNGRNGADSAVHFRHNGATEYVQITSYSGGKRLLLSWAVIGFRKAQPLLGLCKEVEFDSDSFSGAGKAPPDFQIADGEYHYKATIAIAKRDYRKIKPGEYWHLVLKGSRAIRERPIQNALMDFWHARAIIERGSDVDEEMAATEGTTSKGLVVHRKREAKLRRAKITAALKASGGHLVCEVPRCGFNFEKRYGALGFAYAEVHHKKPLAARATKGRRTNLRDLAIVCANCHRMIHKGGECRPLEGLIPT